MKVYEKFQLNLLNDAKNFNSFEDWEFGVFMSTDGGDNYDSRCLFNGSESDCDDFISRRENENSEDIMDGEIVEVSLSVKIPKNPSDNIRKVVVNKCFGGFGLSYKAEEMYEKYTGKEFESYSVSRDDAVLVYVVESLGDVANGSCAELSITEIPADVDFQISEYDGIEHVAEKHRTWY